MALMSGRITVAHDHDGPVDLPLPGTALLAGIGSFFGWLVALVLARAVARRRRRSH